MEMVLSDSYMFAYMKQANKENEKTLTYNMGRGPQTSTQTADIITLICKEL